MKRKEERNTAIIKFWVVEVEMGMERGSEGRKWREKKRKKKREKEKCVKKRKRKRCSPVGCCTHTVSLQIINDCAFIWWLYFTLTFSHSHKHCKLNRCLWKLSVLLSVPIAIFFSLYFFYFFLSFSLTFFLCFFSLPRVLYDLNESFGTVAVVSQAMG